MDAKTFYEQIAPELDPGGFKLYFTAQKLTGFDLYARCQKSYTTNTFPYSRKENHGEADQYYVEHTHPAIISYEDFQKVQELLKRRAERQSIPHDQTPLARKIICGQCGTLYLRRISKAGYVTWVCRRHDRKA